MTPREERKARARAAVEALLNRDNDAWSRYQRERKEMLRRTGLPKRMERARAHLAKLEAEARELGLDDLLETRQ